VCGEKGERAREGEVEEREKIEEISKEREKRVAFLSISVLFPFALLPSLCSAVFLMIM
jgi:hypothetical protein